MANKRRALIREARRLVKERRRAYERTRPCPACGYEPNDGFLQVVNAETGLDTDTGKPPCDTCLERADKYDPGKPHRIEMTMTAGFVDGVPESYANPAYGGYALDTDDPA